MKYLNHNLDSELGLMREYNITPGELFAIKVILLAQDGEDNYLQNYAQICPLRPLLESIQSKGIILKSYKLPPTGTAFIPEAVQFNQNFLKKYYRSAFEMGEELFYTYPQSILVQGQIFNLRTVSKKFDSLEEAFSKYAKAIRNNPDLHSQIISNIRWGIENGYNFTTLDRFIIDRGWEALDAIKNGEGSNLNLEATELV